MTIESENEFFPKSKASVKLINEIFADSEKSKAYIILGDDDNWIQASSHRSKHGLNYIEYKESEESYCCVCSGKAHEKIKSAFIKYYKGDNTWRNMFEWVSIDEEEADDIDWNEEVDRLEFEEGDEGELVLTNSRVYGTIISTTDDDEKSSTVKINSTLDQIDGVEIVTHNVPWFTDNFFTLASVTLAIVLWSIDSKPQMEDLTAIERLLMSNISIFYDVIKAIRDSAPFSKWFFSCTAFVSAFGPKIIDWLDGKCLFRITINGCCTEFSIPRDMKEEADVFCDNLLAVKEEYESYD